MQFTASLVAAILLATAPALGFIVPEGAEDGIYTVERDASGQEVHIRQGDISSGPVARAVRGSNLKRGGLDQWGCFKDQSELDHGNCDSAVSALRGQIGDGGRGVGNHMGLYSISGEVVAYCCNNRAEGNTCYLSDQSESNTGITNLCGWYRPGYAYNSGAHLTYGYQHKSYSWCPEH
ncbi:hypothetical protein DL95DRAFT_460563 [Leptodontidium sp. 2 PMI_412]|nr:hypothetical protein BKA61DRAFT_664961 [Leptodontidium sp. MPI-SDFR-AT-0119]KAH9216020.1 hypothetical protein DL95DRAFT_460563 [Leptodontidium sp. 2 PMI_412]